MIQTESDRLADARVAWTTATSTPAATANIPFDPCDYHTGHRCRACGASITDLEYLASGLFLSLCTADLARAKHAMRVAS